MTARSKIVYIECMLYNKHVSKKILGMLTFKVLIIRSKYCYFTQQVRKLGINLYCSHMLLPPSNNQFYLSN
jgi:hypothetical protein